MTCGRCLNQHHPRPYVPHGIAASPIGLRNLKGILRMPNRRATDSVQGRGRPRLHNHSHTHKTREFKTSTSDRLVLNTRLHSSLAPCQGVTRLNSSPSPYQGVRQERGDPQRYSLLRESVGGHEPDRAFRGPLSPHAGCQVWGSHPVQQEGSFVGLRKGHSLMNRHRARKQQERGKALFYWQLQHLYFTAWERVVWYGIRGPDPCTNSSKLQIVTCPFITSCLCIGS